MADITKAVEKDVRPLSGAIVQRGMLGEDVTAPALVTLQADGKWDMTNTGTAQGSVRLAIGSGGDGDTVDMVVLGAVNCLSGASAGDQVHGSDNDGNFADAAGTTALIVGYVLDATTLFFEPK